VQEQLERVRQARGSLAKVRAKLLRPSVEAMESCAGDVAKAVEHLQRVEAGLKSSSRRPLMAERAVRTEIEGMRAELKQVNDLLAGAGKFYQGWARLMSGGADDAPANYTPKGRAGLAVCSSKVMIHG
jgi:hypothetical protein